MAEFPALPLFTDAFIADTLHLTAAQTGAYLMLLMAAWRSPDCKLPDDDKILARFARMDQRTWNANKDTILSFWKKDDAQKWYQARLLDERKNVEDKRRKNVAAGKASALKRHKTGSTDVQPEVNQNPTIPKPKPIKEKEDTNVSSKKKSFSRETRFEEFWRMYPRQRRGNREKAMQAYNRAINENRATEEEILHGLQNYIRSTEVKTGFAKGAAAWLNDDRWTSDYGAKGASNKTDRAKAALLRSSNSLGFGSGREEGADESDISVFSGAENLRQGTGISGINERDIPLCPEGLLVSADRTGDGVLPEIQQRNADSRRYSSDYRTWGKATV